MMRDLLLLTILPLMFGSCAGNKEPLQIITRVLTSESTNLIQEFKAGETIGLYIGSESVHRLYHNSACYKNVKVSAKRINGKICWQQYPEVLLNTEVATIYAYYPYQADIDFNIREMPIKLAPNTADTPDYMYGTQAIGQKPINNASPVVLLSMNHALTLVEFQLGLETHTDSTLRISAIQIGNKPGGTALASVGSLDILSGHITGSTDQSCLTSTLLSLDPPIPLQENRYCRPLSIKLIPTGHPIQDGDVEALFTIGQKRYMFSIPGQTTWEKSKRYLYKLLFHEDSLRLCSVTVHDWQPGPTMNGIQLIR